MVWFRAVSYQIGKNHLEALPKNLLSGSVIFDGNTLLYTLSRLICGSCSFTIRIMLRDIQHYYCRRSFRSSGIHFGISSFFNDSH